MIRLYLQNEIPKIYFQYEEMINLPPPSRNHRTTAPLQVSPGLEPVLRWTTQVPLFRRAPKWHPSKTEREEGCLGLISGCLLLLITCNNQIAVGSDVGKGVGEEETKLGWKVWGGRLSVILGGMN